MRGSRVKVLLVPSFSYAAMHLFKARLLFTEALLSPDGIQSPSFSQTGLKPAPPSSSRIPNGKSGITFALLLQDHAANS